MSTDRSSEWVALLCSILSGSDSGPRPPLQLVRIQGPLQSPRRDAWITEALHLRNELETCAQLLHSSDRARAYARCCVALAFLEKEQLADRDAALFQVEIASFITSVTSRMEALQQHLVHQHNELHRAQRMGILACITQALQLHILQPFARLQQMRERPSLKLALAPTAMPRHVLETPIPLTLDTQTPVPYDNNHSIWDTNDEYDIRLDSIWEHGIRHWFAHNRDTRTTASLGLPLQNHKETRTNYSVTDNIQHETQQIHMQQVQLLSHEAHTIETQHPLEQQMMDITALLSQFTQLLTLQQDDVVYIHDSAKLSLDHVKAGKEQIQEAAIHKKKRKHALRHLFAWIIFIMAWTLLFFHSILP